VLVAVLLLAGVTGCGDDGRAEVEERLDQFVDRLQEQRRAKVERAVDAGMLPPVALEIFEPNGMVNVSIVDGPRGGDEDVVRTRDGGRTGPKLRWDLDRDGRIERDERTITERELYDATLGLPSG
jgi:hypothetical protein